MSYLQTFQVFPNIPEPLLFIEELSRNLWWCWHLDAVELFRRINPRLWNSSGRNPIIFSSLIPQERLEDLARDESFLAHLKRVKETFERQVKEPIDYSNSPYGRKNARTLSFPSALHISSSKRAESSPPDRPIRAMSAPEDMNLAVMNCSMIVLVCDI